MSDADAPARDRCPRCGGAFQCGFDGPGPCACASLAVAPVVLARLRDEFHGCLCLRCLAELARAAQ